MSARPRLAREDWVGHGLAELSARGTEAIKLEETCASAGRTRGSFYHHFADHGAFLTALAQGWADSQTEALAPNPNATAEAAAASLTEAALQIDYRLELAIRELARRTPEVAAIVAATDARRLEILTDIYAARFDLDRTRAGQYAMLEYAAFCGIILIQPDMEAGAQTQLAALYDETVRRALKT